MYIYYDSDEYLRKKKLQIGARLGAYIYSDFPGVILIKYYETRGHYMDTDQMV